MSLDWTKGCLKEGRGVGGKRWDGCEEFVLTLKCTGLVKGLLLGEAD